MDTPVSLSEQRRGIALVGRPFYQRQSGRGSATTHHFRKSSFPSSGVATPAAGVVAVSGVPKLELGNQMKTVEPEN